MFCILSISKHNNREEKSVGPIGGVKFYHKDTIIINGMVNTIDNNNIYYHLKRIAT